MRDFWDLVGFEYKKIRKRKSAVLAVSAGVLISIISVWGTLMGNTYINGEVFESNCEAVKKDLTYAKALNGRILDTELLEEASQAYGKIPENTKIPYIGTEEYQIYARAYSPIYGIASRVYKASGEEFSYEEMAALTKEEAQSFYETRERILSDAIWGTAMSEDAKESVQKLSDKVQTPLTYSSTEGYSRFLTLMQSTGIVCLFVIAICLAPLFAGEYTSHTDQLLLSSRYGKGKLIWAKVFTGFSFAAGFSLLLLIQTWLQCMLTFGFDGKNTPFQIHDVLQIYPLTMGQASLFAGICFFFSGLLTAGLTMLLSVRFRSPFGVMIVMSVFLTAPMMLLIPQQAIHAFRLFLLLPTNSLAYFHMFHLIQYEIAGLVLPPYVMFPLFSLVCIWILSPFIYRGFRKHEIR